MTIEIVTGGYYVGLWFAQGEQGNFLACIYRAPTDTERRLVYRFRWFVDDKVHDSDDVKSWYEAVFPASKTDDELIAIMSGMLGDLQRTGFCRADAVHKIVIKGGYEEAVKAYQQLPFFDAKIATPEEVAKIRKGRPG